MSRVSTIAVSLVLLVVLGVACSDDGGNGPDAPPEGARTSESASTVEARPPTIESATRPPDACLLLTVEEIEAATGTAPVEPPSASTELQCAYASAATPDFFTMRVAKEASREQFETRAAGLGGAAVEGLGDAAYQNASGTALLVLAGGWSLRLDYPAAADPLILQDLAAQALARFE